MGGLFSSSAASGKVKVNVKDLKTGRTISIDVQKPFEYTVDQLLGQVASRLPRADKTEKEHISLKYKKKDITMEDSSVTILGKALDLDSSSADSTTTVVNLYYERIERRGALSRDWVIYIKTLTGKVFDINFYSPQGVSVIGLKLLIEEEYGGDIKPDQMRLVLDSHQLEDSTQLVENIPGASNECTIHLVMKGN